MEYDIKVIRKSEHKTTTWSGGTTTQLYIYPESSLYSELNFIFRISSAKVNVNESMFTHLPGIDRKIMIIDGVLDLEHEGHHKAKLNKFEQDSFKGEWTTRSYGKVTDFNLMMNNQCSGELEYIKINSQNFKSIDLSNYIKENFYNKFYKKVADIFYCLNHSVDINLHKEINLNEGDLLVVMRDINDNLESINIFNNSMEEVNVIKIKTYF